MIGEIQSIVQNYLNVIGIPFVIHGTIVDLDETTGDFSVRIDDKTIISSDIIEVPVHLRGLIKMKVPKTWQNKSEGSGKVSGSSDGGPTAVTYVEGTVKVDEGKIEMEQPLDDPNVEMPAQLTSEIKLGSVVALLQFDSHQQYYLLGRVS